MYIKIENDIPKPYSIGELRLDNPNTSFPEAISAELLASYNVFECSAAEYPSYDARTQIVEDGDFVLIDGSWVKTWNVVDKTAEQIAQSDEAVAFGVRDERNRRLAETDYTALSDQTMSPAMAAYRQALRDVTEQAGFPHDVVWPEKPEC